MTEQLGTTVSRLPVLPLRGLVAFPNMIIHFDVGRLLSIRALEAAMKNGQTLFLSAQRDLKTDNPSPSDLYQVGTICQVKQILRLPGDNIRVLVEGKQRALAHQFFAAQDEKSCIYAEVEPLEDYVFGVTERRAQALVRTAQERFTEYADNAPRISPDVELTVAEGGDAGFLADYIAQNISVEVSVKQDILEELSITRRLTMVIRLLGEETEVLKLENEIQDEVKSQMDKNQREYYLREQIKVIQTELGEQDAAAEAEAYRTRILDLKLPQECEEKLIREVDRFAKLGGSNAEQGVVRTYLDTVLDLPWRSKSEERLDLEEAQRVLDRDHYGMKKVKERIMEFLAVRSLAPSLKGQVLCLAGPPGVGKTSIAKSIAEAMGRNYARMSLGGVRDEADIRGHRKTYIGAMPGRIMDALRRAGTSNPLILLDEIDKMGNDFRGDPASAMLEVLDTEPLITDGTRSDAGEAGKQGEIEFRNVCFTYPDSREAMLEGINFTAKKGETVAFIGSTGSGKSSLINLVPRFYDATQGEVLVDGVNVRDYTLKALRDKIGYVPQQSFLFKGTIASNVSYGDNPLDTTDAGIVDMADTSTAAGRKREKELIATQNEHRTLTSEQRADVRNACEVAQATEFIATKEKQYDSAISQGGSNVSGGQKQRLSIARAVYRHPEILIFDDSFSALDFKTDRAVRDALAKEAKDSTKLIVAQRIGTIMDADRIVVLDDGKVVGQGTHSELLENCDVYRQIAQSQLSEDELNGGKSGESKLPGETGKPIETGKPSVESELNESEGR